MIADLTRRRNEDWETHWRDIEMTARDRRVLLVEGDDDVAVMERIFEKLDPLWVARVHVAPAGDRDKVLRRLRRYPDPRWHGLVDRDVWGDEEAQRRQADIPRLAITAGWCLENHLCRPDLLESAFALSPAVRVQIQGHLDPWLAYGAIRWVLQQSRDRVGAVMPRPDYGRPNKHPYEPWDEASLRTALRSYEAALPSLTIDSLIRQIRWRAEALRQRPMADQIEVGIHGKEFFTGVVAPTLSQAIRQQSAGDWRIEIARRFPLDAWPGYLVDLARGLLAG